MKKKASMSRRDSMMLAGGLAVGTIGAIAALTWGLSGATGTVDICQSEDPSLSWVILLDVVDASSSRRSSTSRRITALDASTGKTGERFDAGKSGRCLGGLRANVVLSTAKDGIHVRDPKTGAIVVTEKALLGDLAGNVTSFSYDRSSHRLGVTTKFNDRFVLDLATNERWSAKNAPRAVVPKRTSGLTPLEHLYPFATTIVAGSSNANGFTYALDCDGSRCKLATHAVNAYGNTIGVDPTLHVLPSADELLVASIVRFLPDSGGVLVSCLASLDEATRRLVRVGLDGKVKWTVPIREKSLDGWIADGTLVLGTFDPPRPPMEGYSRVYLTHELDAWFIDLERGAIVSEVHIPKRIALSQDLADAAARVGDVVLVASHGEVWSMPIKGGPPRWKKRF